VYICMCKTSELSSENKIIIIIFI